MSEKLISVIVPVFNAERHLKQCIDSILGQTHKSIELILVDDGSTDNSEHICRQFKDVDSRVVYFRIPNSGPLKARAYGLGLCHGDWFAFCDADDYYSNKASLKTALQITEDCSCDVLQYGFIMKYHHIKKKEATVNSLIASDKEDFIQRDYPALLCNQWQASRLTLTVWNKLYSRKLIGNSPNAETLPRCFFGEDLILNLFLLKNCNRIVYSPDYLYTYRYGGGTSIWRETAMEDLDLIKSFQSYFLTDWHGEKKEEIRNYLYSEMASWLYLHIQSGLETVSEEEMRGYIIRTLDLPMFQEAHRYYLLENSEKWDAVSLLRNADPDAYILSAKNAVQNRPVKNVLKSKLVSLLKQI